MTIISEGKKIVVSWYIGSDSLSIERAIRAGLQLGSEEPLKLQDSEGRVVAISDALPDGLTLQFTKESIHQLSEPKGPPEWPFVGNAFDVIDHDGSQQAIINLLQAYAGMVALKLQGRRTFICSDAEVLQDMLSRPEIFAKIVDGSSGLGNLRKKSIGSGLFTSSDTDELWQIAHRILLPGFGVEAIRHYYDRMVEIASELLAHLDALPANQPILITDWMTRMTFEAIGYAGFSTRFHSMDQEELPPFVHAMVTSLTDAMKANRRILPSWLYFMANRRRQAADEVQKNVVMEIIQQRKTKMARGEVFPDDLLQLMLTGKDRVTNRQLPEENIGAQLITFLIAGHETTSGLLSYAIYHLIKHPEIEQKLIEEVDMVLGRDYSYCPSYDDLDRLPYTLKVLKETLRLDPTAPGFGKTAMQDTTAGNKYLLKKGDTTRFYLPALHRDPKYWPNPEVFDPERFTPEAESKRHPGCYHPFGGGMRACIGFQFALKEATMVLARLYQRYKFRFSDSRYQLHHMRTLTVKPKDFYVLLEKRPEEKGHFPPKKEQGRAEASSTAIPPVSENAPPILFLYGSNMGHCQEIAQKLAGHMQSKGFRPIVKELDAQVGQPWESEQVIIITSTYNGTPPDNALKFDKWIKGLSGSPFEALHFSVLGVGNKQWHATFQHFPRYVNERMQALGAKPFYEMGIADVDGDYDQAIETWAKGAWVELQKLLPATGLDIVKEEPPQLIYTCEVVNFAGSHVPLGPFIPLDQYIQPMQIKENRELLSGSGARSTKHIEITLPKEVSYRAGNHLGILPANPIENIALAAKLCNIRQEDAVVIKSLQEGSKSLPLGTPVLVKDLLHSCVDLMGPVSRKEMRLLTHYCQCPAERVKLAALAEAEFAQEILGKELTFLDICQQFRSINCSLDLLLSARPALKPRYYSISSSPQVLPESMSITVAVQEHQTKANRTFKGLCSHYLANQNTADSIFCFVKDTKSHFRLPDDATRDLILIGPGTGLAPLRGFLQERSCQRQQQVPIGRQLLFFGCRHPEQDFLYRQEIEGYYQSGLLQGLFVAFSRYPDIPKTYVQDLLRQQAALVWGYVQAGASILVCGDGKAMAPAVRQALIDVFAEQGKLPQSEAEKLFKTKMEDNLYVEDVWAG